MPKRELSPTTDSNTEPKSKRKSTKKHATTAPPDETACFQAAFNAAKLPAVGTASTPAKVKIKQEDGDEHAGNAVKQTPSTEQNKEKLAKKKVRDAPAAVTAASSKAAATASSSSKDNQKHEQRPAVIELETSEEDSSSSDDDDDDDDDEIEEDSKSAQTREFGTAERYCAESTLAKDSNEVSLPSSRNHDILSALRGRSREIDLYLMNLAQLPWKSSAIDSSLRELVFQCFLPDFEVASIAEAFEDPRISEELTRRGATPTRLKALSKLLREADIVEDASRWMEKILGRELFQSVCARHAGRSQIQRDERHDPAKPSARDIRPPPNAAPRFNHERFDKVNDTKNGNVVAQTHDTSSYWSPRPDRHDRLPTVGGPSQPGVNHTVRGGAALAQRSSDHGSSRGGGSQSRGRGTGHSQASRSPYAGNGGFHKRPL